MTLFFLIVIASAIYLLFIYKDGDSGNKPNNTSRSCPNCGSSVERHFNVCPICKETLRISCPNCGEKVSVKWGYCPYCEYTLHKDK